MNGMTTDIYFDLKDKDNDAYTNENSNRDDWKDIYWK